MEIQRPIRAHLKVLGIKARKKFLGKHTRQKQKNRKAEVTQKVIVGKITEEGSPKEGPKKKEGWMDMK